MIATMDLIRLCIDSGLFVLIWLVQLVIYPSFSRYAIADLKRWHGPYTKRITFVVLPLMSTQLVISAIQVVNVQNAFTIGYAALVFSTWILTFLLFVPLHGKIDTLENPIPITRELTTKNWSRTMIWSAILILSIDQIM